MSDPWAEFRAAPSAAPAAVSGAAPVAGDPWGDFRPAPPGPPRWSGGMLPVSEGPDGKPQFDSNAGLIGSLKRMVMTPGDVMAGKVDTNTEEGFGRALELGMGISPMPPAIRAAKMGAAAPKVPAPSSQALKEAADQGYTAVRDMGVDYAPSAVEKVMTGLRASLEKDGMLAKLAPQTHSIIDDLTNAPAGAVLNINGLEAARRAAGFAAKDFTKPAEQVAASKLISQIDQFIAAADPSSVVAGPATAAGETIVKARANSAAQKRSDSLTGIEERADLRSAAANSGGNLDNTIRQRVADVLLDPKKARGFTPEELGGLEKVVVGDPVRNGLRTASNMLGGGGGLGAAASAGVGGTIGASIAGPLGAAIGGATPPAVGMVAKALQNSMSRRALNAMDTTTRQRSPLYQEQVAEALMVPRDMLGSQAIIAGGAAALPFEYSTQPPKSADQKDALMRRLVKLLAEGGA